MVPVFHLQHIPVSKSWCIREPVAGATRNAATIGNHTLSRKPRKVELAAKVNQILRKMAGKVRSHRLDHRDSSERSAERPELSCQNRAAGMIFCRHGCGSENSTQFADSLKPMLAAGLVFVDYDWEVGESHGTSNTMIFCRLEHRFRFYRSLCSEDWKCKDRNALLLDGVWKIILGRSPSIPERAQIARGTACNVRNVTRK